jgi:hypothetical protein
MPQETPPALGVDPSAAIPLPLSPGRDGWTLGPIGSIPKRAAVWSPEHVGTMPFVHAPGGLAEDMPFLPGAIPRDRRVS